MDDALRTCMRTGCRWPAAACLSYRYATREVWLAPLGPVSEPALWELCPDHADGLTVPRGWQLRDERTPVDPPVEPAGRELLSTRVSGERTAVHARAAGAAGQPAPAVAPSLGVDRYAELWADLPRLAAEHGHPAPDRGAWQGDFADALQIAVPEGVPGPVADHVAGVNP